MAFQTDFFLLLMLTSLFNQNYAGVFRQIEKSQFETLPQYYSRMRSNNVNRGVLLTMSSKEKKEVCDSVFTSKQFKNAGILSSDDIVEQISDSSEPSEDEFSTSIVVRKMIREGQIIAEEEIFVRCAGTEPIVGMREEPQIEFYYVSFAFETQVFFVSQIDESDDFTVEMVTDYNLTMSPEISLENQFIIRDLFVVMQQNMEALREESPKYVEMIEETVDVRALSNDNKFLLCGSILSSPQFQSQNLEIDLDWVEKRETISIYNRPIHFLNEDYTRNEIRSQNILCKARDSSTLESHTFYYTPSYSSKNSVFFLRIEDSDLQFDSYVENIPILMNAQRKSSSIEEFDRDFRKFVEDNSENLYKPPADSHRM